MVHFLENLAVLLFCYINDFQAVPVDPEDSNGKQHSHLAKLRVLIQGVISNFAAIRSLVQYVLHL